ncbi:MAG TPA: acyltransferase [Gemmatimonadaceae bacterium]|nr:acyltransferase [Gemmatimonadaceae bacterium]
MIYDKLFPRLSRKTTSGRFIAEIDGLRFIAIALVVIFHIRGYVAAKSPAVWSIPPETHLAARLTEVGHFGVQLFFIISGFVLALPFATRYLAGGPVVSLRAYLLRRLTRLEPPYIIAMTAFFLLLVARADNTVRELGPHFLASVAYVHNLVYEQGSLINVVAWSLEIEVQFYLLAPLLSTVFAIRSTFWRRAVIGGTSIALALVQWKFVDPGSRLGLSLFNFAQFFLAGFLLADIYLVEWRQQPSTDRKWDVLALVGWVAVVLSWMTPLTERLVFPFAALLAYTATFRGPLAHRVFTNPWITVIGGMCYTIYLLHYPFISAAGARTISLAVSPDFGVNLLVQTLLLVPPLMIVSTLYFLLIERPCMERDWPRRLAQHMAEVRRRTFLRWFPGLTFGKPGDRP